MTASSLRTGGGGDVAVFVAGGINTSFPFPSSFSSYPPYPFPSTVTAIPPSPPPPPSEDIGGGVPTYPYLVLGGREPVDRGSPASWGGRRRQCHRRGRYVRTQYSGRNPENNFHTNCRPNNCPASPATLGNPVVATAKSPTDMMFFCVDEKIEYHYDTNKAQTINNRGMSSRR